MKVLNVLLIGLAMMIGTVTVNAQEAKQQKTPEERAQAATDRLTKLLELTPEQQSKVGELNLGIVLKNQAIRNDTSKTKEQKQAEIKANRDAGKAQLKLMLTDEQNQKLAEHEAAMKAKKEEHKANTQSQGKSKGKGKQTSTSTTTNSTTETEDDGDL